MKCMAFAHDTAEQALAERASLTPEVFAAKYSRLAEECPVLWEKITNPDSDLEMLATMLKELKQVKCEQSFKAASEKMGVHIFNTYAGPSVG